MYGGAWWSGMDYKGLVGGRQVCRDVIWSGVEEGSDQIEYIKSMCKILKCKLIYA